MLAIFTEEEKQNEPLELLETSKTFKIEGLMERRRNIKKTFMSSNHNVETKVPHHDHRTKVQNPIFFSIQAVITIYVSSQAENSGARA